MTRAFLQPRGGALGRNGVLFSTAEKTSDTTAESLAMAPSEKLQALRARMKELDLDVYLVPSDDPHLSGKRAVVLMFGYCNF